MNSSLVLKWFRHILCITVMFSTTPGNPTVMEATPEISGLEKQVNDICKMLTKTVSDVASVYDQNTSLLGYKNIVGQVMTGLPQYQEMERENERLLEENDTANKRINELIGENVSLKLKLAELSVENVKLEIEETSVGGSEHVPEQELVEAEELEEAEEQDLSDQDTEEDTSDIELEEVEIDGKMYFVEVGMDEDSCAIFNITGDDEIGDEIGFMLNGEVTFTT